MNENNQSLDSLQELANFEFHEISDPIDIENKNKYSKLPLDAAQIDFIQQYVPQLSNANLLNSLSKKQLFSLKFPDGVVPSLKSLMQYADGGYDTTTILKNKFWKHAHLFKEDLSGLKDVAWMTSIFSLVSFATGQYFLAEINSKLDKISQSVDNILSFLYGDKKAELLSEISFIQYAQNCYSSIMQHEEQRIATITGIQNAKKVAVKDIEFYLNDLEAAVSSANSASPSGTSMAKTVQTKRLIQSLELALQLYTICCILEVYYSQNFDKHYLNYVIDTASQYVDAYKEKIRNAALKLTSRATGSNFDLKQRKESVEKMLESLPSGQSAIRTQLENALLAPLKQTEIYLTSEGEAYYAIQ